MSNARAYLAAAGLSGAAYLYENHAAIAAAVGGLNFAELSICALVAQCERTGKLRPEQLAFIESKLGEALAERNPLPVMPASSPAAPPAVDHGPGGALVPRPVPPDRKPPGGVRVPLAATPAVAW